MRRSSWADLTDAAVHDTAKAGLLLCDSRVGADWIPGEKTQSIVDPATQKIVATTTWCHPDVIDFAIDCASSVQQNWAKLRPSERGSLLRLWAAELRSKARPLAQLITLEQGKTLQESLGEIEYAASFIDWFSGEAERPYGETIPSHKPASRLTVDMQPIGVVGIVTPWNFPCAMIARKAAAALAAGCTVVVKPAPETPLSALALARLAELAGLPPGAINVVNGDAPALTARLLDRPEVRAFSFTGSTEVGRMLMASAAKTVKRVSLELGGHAPFVVFDDASLSDAIDGCIRAKFTTSGQDCLAANRVYVQRPIYQEFCERLKSKVIALTVGHGLDGSIDVGPLTKLSVVEKCQQHITDALRRGASCLAGGQPSNLGPHFVNPALLVDVGDEMRIATEETFGPVVAVLPFDDEDEVIARANASEMGLAAYVYTESLGRATRASQSLEYGMVGVNTASFTGPPIPFGGWKQSGLGREGSRHGIFEFMEFKYTCIGGLGN